MKGENNVLKLADFKDRILKAVEHANATKADWTVSLIADQVVEVVEFQYEQAIWGADLDQVVTNSMILFGDWAAVIGVSLNISGMKVDADKKIKIRVDGAPKVLHMSEVAVIIAAYNNGLGYTDRRKIGPGGLTFTRMAQAYAPSTRALLGSGRNIISKVHDMKLGVELNFLLAPYAMSTEELTTHKALIVNAYERWEAKVSKTAKVVVGKEKRSWLGQFEEYYQNRLAEDAEEEEEEVEEPGHEEAPAPGVGSV